MSHGLNGRLATISPLPFPHNQTSISLVLAGQLLSFCPGPLLPQAPVLALLPCSVSFKLAPTTILCLLALALTERAFDSTNAKENTTKKKTQRKKRSAALDAWFPVDLLPILYSHIPHLYRTYIISSPSPLHGSMPHALAVHWGSDPSCFRAMCCLLI